MDQPDEQHDTDRYIDHLIAAGLIKFEDGELTSEYRDGSTAWNSYDVPASPIVEGALKLCSEAKLDGQPELICGSFVSRAASAPLSQTYTALHSIATGKLLKR